MSYYHKETDRLFRGVFVKKINDMYKVTTVPCAHLSGVPRRDERDPDNAKTKNALCRARNTVLEIAYCNEWDYFVTMTFDKCKVKDRYQRTETILAVVKWLQNKARTYGIKYLLIPELHKDGAFHAHGLLRFDRAPKITPFKNMRHAPDKLRNTDYVSWDDYAEKFGFCSMGEITSHKAVSMYLTKYITKEMQLAIDDFNKHTYFASKGLARGEKIGGFHNPREGDILHNIPWDYIDEENEIGQKLCNSWDEVQELLKDFRHFHMPKT